MSSRTRLSKHPKFAPLIKKYGPPDFTRPGLGRGKNVFRSLCRSIIYQQVSGKAAESILKKFIALYPGKSFPTPQEVIATSVETLRRAGLSPQKASYIKDLAEKFSDGTISTRTLTRMSNDEIIEHLTQVKGIGVWTVHMFLIFTLNRPNILPTGDLGIRKGFKTLFALKSLPSAQTMERLAREWRDEASIASWYLWRVADDNK